MKNKIAIILIAGALNVTTLTQAQSNQRGQGAPNSVRGQSGQNGEGNSVNRQSVRQPLSNSNNGQQGNSGQTRNSEQGGGQSGRKPQSGMTRTENGGQQQRERVNIKETLDLTDEQASQLRAIHEKWQKIAKAIHSNKELSKEEKKAKLKAAFKKMDAAVRELLSEEQYAKLVKLRRSNARPNQNGNEENEHRRELRQILELTEEQAEKLRAVHRYALKKIKGIIANEELSKEEKKKQIKNVKKQAHNRRMEILTEEQKEKLRKWRAHQRAQRQQQNQNGGGNSSGRPQPQQGGREQGGREQGVAKVTLYCIPSCGYCTKAANLLKSNGVEFERKNISADKKARGVLAKKTKEAGINWRGGVPVIIAGDKIIVGFNKTALNRIK
ncbi:MAG: hypothetical protein HOL43_01475 [Verrucomicrobiales bacterium]|nr:hypothetical protein [Verrucomicrobiales bacterium]